MSLFSDPYPQKQERDQKCLSIILSVSIQSLTLTNKKMKRKDSETVFRNLIETE